MVFNLKHDYLFNFNQILNLFQFPSTRSIPIMTSSSAVGIIIGTGNVGKHLKQRSNVFLSADAGVSWHQVNPNINI